VVGASASDELHDGSGLTAVFDVTRVRDRLEEQGRWDPDRVHVSFRAVTPVAAEDEADREEATPADARAGQVTVVVA